LIIICSMSRKVLAAAAVAAIAIAIAWSCGKDRRACNVLLVSIDTLRPDRLGCYGYEGIETPNIDALADDGFLFADAIATVPLTLPSHVSLLTGLLPMTTSVRDNGAFVLPDQFVTLAEALKEEGYSTGGFVSSFVIDARFGLGQGFDVYDDDMDSGAAASAFYWPERRAGEVNDAAREWLTEVQEPFFAFVHYYDPHLPYDPPAPFDSLYAGRPYDGEVAYTDRVVGELMAMLRARGALENTLVVLVSDHGEGLGDHDERGHGALVYETTMKVAFIIKFPEGCAPGGTMSPPSRIGQAVQLTDVFPTVLDFLGIDWDHAVEGTSLMPLLRGERISPRFLYFESLYPYFNFKWCPLRGVRHNEWKYILAPEEELYNVAEDPGETSNLALEEAERAEQLRAQVMEIGSRESEALEAAQRSMSQDDVKKLLALGYLAGGRPTLPTDLEPKGRDPKTLIDALGELLWGGRKDFDEGDFETAAAKFARFAEIDPTNPQARVHLAKAFMEMGRTDEAEAEFKKAIEIDSTHAGAFFPLANIARSKGNLDEALFYLEVAAHFSPETPGVLANIGGLLVETGRPDSGIVVLREALKMDQRDRSALLNMGLAHMAKGQPGEAEKWFRATLAVDPGSVKALANVANIFISRGQMDSTIHYLERANRADPQDATILANLGNAYRQQGKTVEAGEAYDKVLALEPENVMALYGLAAVRAGEGNSEESISILERILEINPGFTPAKQTLEVLQRQESQGTP
jgi:arylsulfatase A-like enzyme/Tfp pilus assembly protein PilF